ncbi:STAGA complex 65 subunit gamma [Octopus bimaculoides]|nr:STAGA complex 65 subunit gamma [Octopus bimaculoides]
MTSHWGDMPAVGDTDSAFAKMERDQLTKRRPMEIQGPRLYQTFSKQYSTSTKPAPQEKFQIDPLTLHTIRLLQHIRKMKNLIQQVTAQHENAKPDAELTFPPPLPIPEYTGPDTKPKMTKPFSHMPYTRESVVDVVLSDSKESCLELMTDIVQEYYSRIMKHMRSAVDNQLLHEQIGFPDVVEQVFHECGIGSVTELHDFYQNRVLRYHDNMLQQSQQLVSEYEKLKQSGGPKPAETFTLIRIRDEPSSDIQFPELEEKDDVVDTEHLLHLKGWYLVQLLLLLPY